MSHDDARRQDGSFPEPPPLPATHQPVLQPVPPRSTVSTQRVDSPRDGLADGPAMARGGFPLPSGSTDRGPSPLPPQPSGSSLDRPSWKLLALGLGAVVVLLLGVGAVLLVVQPWSQQVAAGATVPAGIDRSPSLSGGSGTASSSGTDSGSHSSPPTAPDPASLLASQLAQDRSTAASLTEGVWVPQLSSKRVGLVAAGRTYDASAIWQDHRSLRARYPGALLLWSGDYSTFTTGDFYVTVDASVARSSAEAVNSWCAAQHLSADNCYAKRIGTGTYGDTTRHR